MQRLSRLFWFTVFAGTISSAFLSYALARRFTGQVNTLVALCAARNDTCSVESINRAFQVSCMTDVAATLLLFWFAYKIGRSFIKPVSPIVTDAAR
jgi:hypothetical protein